MFQLPIKALSINAARQGQQYHTPEAKQYKIDLAKLLMAFCRNFDVPDGDLEIHYVFGVSNWRSDIDNFLKLASDSICTHLGFDDSRFVAGSQRKEKVKKGDEFIRFEIRAHEPKKWQKTIGI